MASVHVYLLVVVAAAAAASGLQTVDGKLKLTVITTSGCGDTMRFIANQLAPTYALYKNFLEVEFVPWGKTQRLSDGSLSCQFGTSDCFANRVHRCSLDMLTGDQDAQVDYMVCEFTSPYPAYGQGSYECASRAGLNLVNLDYCVTTTGAALDAAAEAVATGPMAELWFVPTIYFNDEFDADNHYAGYQRLQSTVCFALAADPSTGVTDCAV